jgi:hypothetical protein
VLDEGWAAETYSGDQTGRKTEVPYFCGGYNWLEDTITWTTAQTKNSATFISFIEELLVKQHPTGWVVVVMDNASYHAEGMLRKKRLCASSFELV